MSPSASSYLDIVVHNEALIISYIDDGEVCYETTHPAGLTFLETHHFGKRARDEVRTAVLRVLEIISLHDRIPTTFYVYTATQGYWFKETLSSYPYAQFYLSTREVNVIIKRSSAPTKHARYTKQKGFLAV